MFVFVSRVDKKRFLHTPCMFVFVSRVDKKRFLHTPCMLSFVSRVHTVYDRLPWFVS